MNEPTLIESPWLREFLCFSHTASHISWQIKPLSQRDLNCRTSNRGNIHNEARVCQGFLSAMLTWVVDVKNARKKKSKNLMSWCICRMEVCISHKTISAYICFRQIQWLNAVHHTKNSYFKARSILDLTFLWACRSFFVIIFYCLALTEAPAKGVWENLRNYENVITL